MNGESYVQPGYLCGGVLHCPTCRAGHRVGDVKAGESITCPGCKQTYRVDPPPTLLRAMPIAPKAQVPA